MSKMTLERKNDGLWLHVVNGAQQCSFHLGYGLRENGKETLAVQLLRAHLAAQAEWPNEEDVKNANAAYKAKQQELHDLDDWKPWYDCEDAAMRAALQSVLPPVGVVSDEMRELYAAASKGFHTSESSGADLYYTHKSKFHTLKDLQDFSAAWTKAMLASRHAPTKD